jgi:formyl-CoA transferase
MVHRSEIARYQQLNAVPATAYRCRPGGPNDYVVILAQQQMWHALLRAIGRDDLIGDPRYETAESRARHADDVNALIEAWTTARDKHEVMRILAAAGVPCGAVQDTAEVLADPHLRAREMIVEVPHPVRGSYLTAGNPVKLSASPTKIEAAPLLGQHNREILASLGYGDAEIAALKAGGAI